MVTQYIGTTIVPVHFSPLIGQMVVTHASMDKELQLTIIKMTKMDFNAGVSVLTKLLQTRARIEILQNLAITKTRGIKRRAKLLALAEKIRKINDDRNTIVHGLPYSYGPLEDEAYYYRDVNLTYPQIKKQAPLKVTPDSLNELINQFWLTGMWLSMFRNRHPKWNQDAQFPWPDIFRDKVRRENQNRRQTPRKRKAPRRSSRA